MTAPKKNSSPRAPLWDDTSMGRRAWAMGKAMENLSGLSGSQGNTLPNVILVARSVLDVVEKGFPPDGEPFKLSSLPAPEVMDQVDAESFVEGTTRRRGGR